MEHMVKFCISTYVKSNILNEFLISIASDVESEILEMGKVSRLEMGAFLCIASNGVPPSLSKRIQMNVECK